MLLNKANDVCLTNTDISKLKDIFGQVDQDESNEIDYDEFFEFIGKDLIYPICISLESLLTSIFTAPDETKSPFSEAVFALFDEGKAFSITIFLW